MKFGDKKSSGLDPQPAIQLKELDLVLKKQEYETQVLCPRAVEIEAACGIKVCLLEFMAENLRRRLIPPPLSRSPYSCILEVSKSDFSVGKYIKLY